MAGVRTDDPRFVDPEELGERRSISRKQYEKLQSERDIEAARASVRAWADEDIL